MKQWLVTLKDRARLAAFDRAASSLGCHRAPVDTPVSMMKGDVVVRVTGPDSAGPLLATLPEVDDVHPDEPMDLMGMK